MKLKQAVQTLRAMGGKLLLCEECIKRKVSEFTSNIEDSKNKIVDDGMFQTIDTDKQCTLCKNPAKYQIGLKGIMKAMKAHRKK